MFVSYIAVMNDPERFAMLAFKNIFQHPMIIRVDIQTFIDTFEITLIQWKSMHNVTNAKAMGFS